MKTLALASLKGGTGKTTLAAHLAVQASLTGEAVALIDLDAQASLAEWFNAREAETPVYARAEIDALPDTLAALADGGYTLAIIDTPATDKRSLRAALSVCTAVLMPVRPSPNDLRAAAETVEEITAAGKPFRFVISQRITGTRIADQAYLALLNLGNVSKAVIGMRTGFAASMTDGRTAQEIEPLGTAAEEIAALWRDVKGIIE